MLVGPVGTATQNGTALLQALSGITTATATTPWLLKIEPGIYDLGSSAMFMKANVDVEGSGQDTTILQGEGQTTVLGANNAELRELSVTSTGSATFQLAIGDYAATVGFRISNVTATATGTGMFAQGVSGHGTFSGLTLSASGATTSSVGLFDNSNSNSTVVNSKISGTTYSVQLQSGTIDIAGSELLGPASGATCVDSYNGSFVALNASCQ